MDEIAYAKINLALHVRERRPDGYHRIETIFAFCQDGDVLRVAEGEGVHPSPLWGGEGVGVPAEGRRAAKPRTPHPALRATFSHKGRRDSPSSPAEEGERLSLRVVGPFASALAGEENNLILRAARALAARCGVTQSAHLILDKNLPVASGIGGGSADAAAALRLLVRFWDLDVRESDLLALAAGLGADVPACLRSRPMRGEGKGDVLTPWRGESLAGTPLLLVNPGVAVSTAEIFVRWDGVDRGPLPDDPADGRNDLEPAAIAAAPVIAEALAALRECGGARLVRMSGSGATCFALFDGKAERDAAAAAIGRFYPGWWRCATRLRAA
ncbi:MAG TPA: 4-(cytidine 5'-diphospho)-2-C-methyl-D-erythritol kinase [Allosphingosinicella sp.]|jgi:4-diphosphocytidyl-2-C-methyl-D-erythritol kinase